MKNWISRLRTINVAKIESATLLRLLLITFVPYVFEVRPFVSQSFPPIHFPILDLGLSDYGEIFVILRMIYALGIIFMFKESLVVSGGLLAASASAALTLFASENRYQFYFLPPFIFLGFSLERILRRADPVGKCADWPWTLLVASIYGFATFHKALHVHAMAVEMGAELIRVGGTVLKPFCANEHCVLLRVLAFLVIPGEAAMTVFTLARRSVRTRLALAIGFHWVVAWIAFSNVWEVSMMMLFLHLYLLCRQQPQTAATILHGRAWWPLLAVMATLMLGGWMASRSLENQFWGPAVVRTFQSLWSQLPLWFLLWPFFWSRENQEVATWTVGFSTLKAGGARAMASFGAFATVVLLFGFSPLLLARPYSVNALGWTMFSGGFSQNVKYALVTPKTACFQIPSVRGFIFHNDTDQNYVFLGARVQDLERLQILFEQRRKCRDERHGELIPLKIQDLPSGGVN